MMGTKRKNQYDRKKKMKNSRQITTGVSALLAFMLSAAPAIADDDEWEVGFGVKGLSIDTPNDVLQLEFGGRLHLDTVAYDNDITTFQDKSDIRRLRVDVSGRFYNDWRFKVDADVGGISDGFKNVWVSYRGVDGFEIKGGNFIAPFSMEDMMSSNELSSMERSLSQALSPGFLVGGAAKAFGKHWTVTAGYFFNPISADPLFNNDSGESIIARATFAPIRKRNQVLHFGAAVEYRSLDNGVGTRVRTQPEAGLARRRLIDTRTLTGVDSFTNFGLEAGYMTGPLTITSQYIIRKNDAPLLNDPDFNGGYVQVALVLTGESRRYSRTSGVFGGVRPKRKIGAVEIVGRYSMLDLNDGLVAGGEEENLLAGINWYIGRNVRFMANYIRAKASPNRDGLEETVNIVQGRTQLNF
jgi:phosphate-selective porin OprO and OprP